MARTKQGIPRRNKKLRDNAITGINASERVSKKITIHKSVCLSCNKKYKTIKLIDRPDYPIQFPNCCPQCVSKQTTAVRKRYNYTKKYKQSPVVQALVLKSDGTVTEIVNEWESSYDARAYLDPDTLQKPRTLSTYPNWFTCTILVKENPVDTCPENPLVGRLSNLLGLWNPPSVYGDAIVMGPGEKWIHPQDVAQIRDALNIK